jgi:hypothetical protein
MANESSGAGQAGRAAQSTAARPAPSDPFWWRSGFALLSILLGVAAPLTAAINGAYTKSREIEVARQTSEAEMAVARQKEDYALRLQFLDRVVDPKYPAKDRQTILRFLGSAIADPDVRRWANEERQAVDREISLVEKEIAAAESRIAGLERRSATDRRALLAATTEVVKQKAESARLRERLTSVATEPSLALQPAPAFPPWCSEEPRAVGEDREQNLYCRRAPPVLQPIAGPTSGAFLWTVEGGPRSDGARRWIVCTCPTPSPQKQATEQTARK